MMKEVNLSLTEDMLNFDPIDDEMIKFEQRMIYYSKDKSFNTQETQAISQFKIWCKSNDKAIPERDPEILRNLYARKMNN